MEVLCINSSFPADYVAFFKANAILTPEQDKMYGIREIVRNVGKTNSTDNVGFLLEEIRNPKVEQYHPVLGSVKMEPNWSIKRFSNLDGSEISMEQIRAEKGYITANNILNSKAGI